MRIQDLYVGPFPIPRFINLFFKSYARAHVPVHPHTPTHIRTRTHTGSSSKRIVHSKGGIPALCVHDLAKRLERYIIPDNLCKRRVKL